MRTELTWRRRRRRRRQVHINGWFETASDAIVWPRAGGVADSTLSGDLLLLPGALWNEALMASAVEAYVDLLQVNPSSGIRLLLHCSPCEESRFAAFP